MPLKYMKKRALILFNLFKVLLNEENGGIFLWSGAQKIFFNWSKENQINQVAPKTTRLISPSHWFVEGYFLHLNIIL
jgi:hypothetical protein